MARPSNSFFAPFALVVALSTWTSGGVATANEIPPLRPETPPRFTADIVIDITPAGRPSLAVTFSVPYDALQWIKVPGGYGSGAELTIVFEGRDDQPGFGDLWTRRLTTRHFERTGAPNLFLTDERDFAALPGRYEVRAHVRDVHSQLESTARATIEVPDFSKVTLALADLVLGTVDSTGAFSAVPGRRYGTDVEDLAARAVLFDRRSGAWPREYRFLYRVVDERGENVLEGEQPVRLARLADPIVIRPDSSRLFLGAYVFELTLEDEHDRRRVTRSFEVEDSGPPDAETLDRLLEPLAIIAGPDEVASLRALDPADRAAAWEAFWAERDPTPDTRRNEALIEFMRRVRHVERAYRDFGPGWRSDRGRIYIKYGTPDQIETIPATIDGPALEIWYYTRLSRRFVFADEDGFGRYRLVGPTLE